MWSIMDLTVMDMYSSCIVSSIFNSTSQFQHDDDSTELFECATQTHAQGKSALHTKIVNYYLSVHDDASIVLTDSSIE